MKKTLYIAYGSNLNKEQMSRRCPNSEFVGAATLPHYKLEFRRVLTITVCPGASVPVAVWKISRDDLANLDLYEGWPHCYRRESLHVNFADGTGCSAMAYVMNGGYLALPSDSYYRIVADGFRDCGLDEAVLKQALMESRGKMAHLERRGQ